MSESILILFVLPLLALILILGWFIILLRGGRPTRLSLRGFGMVIELDSEHQKVSKHENQS